MRILVFVCCVFVGAGVASAQTVEVGGRLGTGCTGSEDSLCSGGMSPLFGAHASLWAADKFELTAVVSRLNLPSEQFRAFDAPIDVTISDRSRDFVSFLFVYHFMKGSRVRPMLGLGSGWYSEAQRVDCQPAGCHTQLRGGPLLGQYRTWDVDAVFVVGLSSVVRDRWVVRGGWQSHRFGNDENMTQQFFVGAGYRFGGR
jgi:hypothetical protein